MKIINLTTFQQLDLQSPPAEGTLVMYIHQANEDGSPAVWEIKQFYTAPAEPEQ
ncbi:hypothetical protein [Bowmanella denitrificans]|uniref:hypothetical protein n=1 Tax=Bowmanella denitrificans TaxID=366582 RepID=UPI0015586497|nr:hypothetical protein [Bowmanella denitrificans]